MSTNEQLNIELAFGYIKVIFELFKQPLSSSVVDNLIIAFGILLSSDKPMDSSYTTDMLKLIDSILKPLIEEFTSLPAFVNILPCISRTIGNMIAYPDYHILVIEYLMLLENIIKTKFPKKDFDAAVIPEVIPNLRSIKEWFTLVMSVFMKAKRYGVISVVKFILLSQNLILISQQSIEYLPTMGKQDTLFSITNVKELDQAINEMKTRTLILINYMLGYVNDKEPGGLVATPLFNFCKFLLVPGFFTLHKLCTTEYQALSKTLEELHISDLIVALLSFNISLLKDNTFYSSFIQIKNGLIVDIIFALMCSNLKEKCMMVADPNGFVGLALDVCDKQESGVFKTEAGKLLQVICKHLDGCLTFVYSLCEQILSAYCMKTQPNPLLLQFIKTSPFFTQTEPEFIIDTVLLVLSCLNVQLTNRKDLKVQLRDVIVLNIDSLMSATSILIKSRLALMFGCFTCELFYDLPDILMKIINFILEGLTKDKEHKVLSIQCADSFRNIMTDHDIALKLNPHINTLLLYFSNVIETTDSITFFEVLEVVLDVYMSAIGYTVSNLTQALVKRILKESKTQKITVVISKCWDVIITICSLEGFYPAYNKVLEEDLAPTFNFMANPTNIDFDEKLMKTIALIIGRQRSLSDNMIKLYPMLELVYEKNKKVVGNILLLINNYVFYGAQHFASGTLKVDFILKMASQSLATAVSEINSSKAAVLFQIILQNLSSLDTHLPSIILEAINYINTKPMGPVLLIQMYNLLLSVFCNNTSLALKAFEELGKTQEVLERILNDYVKFVFPYDRKVLAIALASILSVETLPLSIVNIAPKMLAVLVLVLHGQVKEELKEDYKKDGKELFKEDANESSESDEEQEESQNTEPDNDLEDEVKDPRIAIYSILNNANSRLKKIDECNYATNAIKILHTRTPERLKAWINSLSPQQQNWLRQITQSKKVATNRSGETVLVTRRIVKPKRRINNN